MTEGSRRRGESDALLAARRERLAEARLYFVCEAIADLRAQSSLLEAALSGGTDVIQLRDKHADDETLHRAAAVFRHAADRHGALFFLNDRPDLVETCAADGVHVGQDDLPVGDARERAGAAALVGLSTHSADQFDRALGAAGDARPDQLSVGPVWETPTKPGRAAAGLDLIRHAALAGGEAAWFAIGGIDETNIGRVIAAGARRVVVVRAVREAPDPKAAARGLRTALERAIQLESTI
jgi:thiamine-phosphate pyrophosphorylase